MVKLPPAALSVERKLGGTSLTGGSWPGAGVCPVATQVVLMADNWTSYARVAVGINGLPDPHNGLHVVNRSPSSRSVTSASASPQHASGRLRLRRVYAHEDTSYSVSGQSGFSCVRVETTEAFGADLASDQQVGVTGWTEGEGGVWDRWSRGSVLARHWV